jgi:hypothetical protein
VEQPVVQARPEVGWDLQGRKASEQLDPALQRVGITPALFTRGPVSLHFHGALFLDSLIEEIREASQELLAVHLL